MREIKFRAKNTIDGNWVYGYYNVQDGIHQINAGHTIYPVHPWSLGQLGVDNVYIGDIVKVWSFYNWSGSSEDIFGTEPQCSYRVYEEYLEQITGEAVFIDGSFCVKTKKATIPLYQIKQGLGREVVDHYLCGFGGNEKNFLEAIEGQIPKSQLNELSNAEGEGFYKLLESCVNNLTKQIEIIGNIYE